MSDSDDRARPLLLAQAAKRDAMEWRYDDVEPVISRLLADIDRLRQQVEKARAMGRDEGMEEAVRDTVCAHGIRWPWACEDCDRPLAAAPQPGCGAWHIEVCEGAAGLALYINDKRVAGKRHNGVMRTVLSAHVHMREVEK